MYLSYLSGFWNKKKPHVRRPGLLILYARYVLQAAGQLWQPSLQWETGRILNLAVHIGRVSFRIDDLIPNKMVFILILFSNLSSMKIMCIPFCIKDEPGDKEEARRTCIIGTLGI